MMLQKQAEDLAKSDLAAAMDKVNLIPLPYYQADTLIGMGEQRIESDSSTARDLLNKALAILAKCDVNPYGDFVAQAAVRVAETAHKLNDDEMTRRALNLGFDTAAKFAKWGMDPDDPNTLPEDMWPSTFNYQNTMRKAAEIYKMGAVTYLDRIQNPDMFLFTQVALAAALLDRHQPNSQGFHSPKKT